MTYDFGHVLLAPAHRAEEERSKAEARCGTPDKWIRTLV